MNHTFLPKLWLFFLFVLFASRASAGTYYIAANGADSNSGTSKSTPWAHLPGMVTWAGSYTPKAGDTFTLRGCDVWGNANFPIDWKWSGASGNVVTVGGEDQTWYNTKNCPSAWNRPVFDAGNAAISGANNVFFIFDIYVSPTPNYVTLDNVEMRNYYWEGGSYSFGQLGFVAVSDSDYVTLSNLYFHHWTHGPASDGTSDENCMLVRGYNQDTLNVHSVFENGVIDNSDGNNDSCYAFYNWSSVENSVIHDIPNAVLVDSASPKYISGNNIYNITLSFSGTHCNAIESVGGGTTYIHDNLIHDISCSGGESMMIGNSGETDYVWNNVLYNLYPGQSPSFPQGGGFSGMSLHFWNNTIVNPSYNCFEWVSGFGGSFNVVDIENNDCISGAGLNNSGFAARATTINNNVTQTAAQANANSSPQYDQYSQSETYVYSPLASTNSTIGAGTNLTSVWPSSFSTNDAGYACSEQTVNGVMQSVCPGRSTTNSRGTSWDAGAYQFGSGPNPPSGLAASVQQ